LKTVISGLTFNVIMREQNMRDDTNMGKSDIQKTEISINKDMSEEMQQHTLIHEWLHMVLCIQGIEHGEAMICALTAELYQTGFRVKVTK